MYILHAVSFFPFSFPVLKQFLYLHSYSLYRLTFHFCSLDIVAATELNMKPKKPKNVLNVLELKPTCIA